MSEVSNIKQRFEDAKTFDEFVDVAIQLKDLWESTSKKYVLEEHFVEEARKVVNGRKLNLLCLTEDWCLDAISSVTAISKLCDAVPELELKLIERDKNLDIMDAHLTRGGRSIPVVILYDESFKELAWWGPRPAELQKWVTEIGKDYPSDEKYKYVRTWYVRDKGASTLYEFIKMIGDN